MRKLWFVLLLWLSTGTYVFSQQCNCNGYYLFAVNPKAANATAQVSGLKMYLVDEEENPITVSGSYYEDSLWKYRKDTLFFWENKKANILPANKPLCRKWYVNIGNYYVVAFYLDSNQLTDPASYPVYKIKIEANNNGLPQESIIMHLPLSKALNICENHLHNDSLLKKPLKTLDGSNFNAIDIWLNQPEADVEDERPLNALKYTVRFDFLTMSSPDGQFNEYILNNARVYNLQSGKLHQEIYIPRITPSSRAETRNIVKFIDFYNRGIREANDFSVQIESWRDLEIKGFRQKLNYYIFDTLSKQYKLDTLLSNYNDVFYYEPAKTMRRYDFLATTTSRIAFTYQLESGKWVLIDKNETFFNPVPPKINYPLSACIQVDEKTHMLPLKAVTLPNTSVTIKDTFWLLNTCKDTLFISKVNSTYRDFFRIDQTLIPGQKTPLVFNGALAFNSFDFHINTYNVSLTFADGSIIGLCIYVPQVSNYARVFYRPDSSISHAIGNTPNARFNTAVFTFTNGDLRVKGTVQDQDTGKKAGSWHYFNDGTLNSATLVYSKSVSLSALDEANGYEHSKFNIKVLENGTWKQPVMNITNNYLEIFITSKTDSIMAYTDTTYYRFALPYKQLPGYISKKFYLLKPGEKTLRIGYYHMPFSLLENKYAIILDNNRFKPKNQTIYAATDTFISTLQIQYPQLKKVVTGKYMYGIDLQNLDTGQRKEIMELLQNDSNVAIICRLYTINHKGPFFCDNRVYAEVDIEDEENFRKKAAKLGYTDIEIDAGNNFYWLSYPGKLLDEDFFELFNKLTLNKKVMRAFLNTYMQPDYD